METPRKTWAVLIGVDFYVEQAHRLEGAVRDAEDFEAFLQTYSGPISIEKFVAKLTGLEDQTQPDGPEASWPTHDNITAAFSKIIDVAVPGDYVYIHFSGHGTLNLNAPRKYREDVGSDAALVVFDSNGVDGMHYLLGAELASTFDTMLSKKLQLAVVLDCCHSGGVSRGGSADESRVRGIPWNSAVASQFLPTGKQFHNPIEQQYDDGRIGETDDHWLLKPNGYILLAACGPNEVVAECRGNDGLPHGIFSYLLLTILTFASRNAFSLSFGSIHQQICGKMHIPYPTQHPVLLGDQASKFLLPNSSSRDDRPRQTCNVINVFPNETIRLNIGYAHGVCMGDEYVIYPLELEDREVMKDSIPEFHFRIVKVNALESNAEQVEQMPDGAGVSTGWHAMLFRRAWRKAIVRLYPDSDHELKKAIESSEWLQLASTQETQGFPMLQLDVVKEMDKMIFKLGATNEVQDLLSLSPEDPRVTQKATLILEHLAKFASTEALDNREADSLLDLQSFEINLSEKDAPENVMVGNRLRINDGATISVTVRNHSQKPLYFAVLIMTPDKQIKRLYPVDRQYRTVVHKTNDFHGIGSFSVKMVIPEESKAQGHETVQDMLKIIVTDRPTSFDVLELPSITDLIKDPERGSSQILLEFLRYYGDNPFNDRRRDGDANASGKWGSLNVIIQIMSTKS